MMNGSQHIYTSQCLVQQQQQHQQQQQAACYNYCNQLDFNRTQGLPMTTEQPVSTMTSSYNNNNNNSGDDVDDDDDIDGRLNDVSGDAADDDDGAGSDAEGIWSADIEQSFLEALAIYPPCGRRKIILSDEGKMYGRNELIARYIKLRTGKTRTRKQVSSHIQVLARRKSKEIQSHIKDQTSRERVLQSLASMSSSQIVSASALHQRSSLKPCRQSNNQQRYSDAAAAAAAGYQTTVPPAHSVDNSQFWNSDPCNISIDSVKSQRLLQQQQQQQSPYLSSSLIDGYPAPGGGLLPVAALQVDTRPSAVAVAAAAAAGVDGYQHIAQSVCQTQGCGVATNKLRLTEFEAFVECDQRVGQLFDRHTIVQISNSSNSCCEQILEEVDVRQIHDKFPEHRGGLKDLFSSGPQSAFFLVKFWADLNTTLHEEPAAFYGVNYQLESPANMTLSISTKVCSFGKQIVEKIETECATSCEYGCYVYRVLRSPICEYMVNFIHKLRQLPEKYMMNSVLENFTVLQVIRNQETLELLLCLAIVFEVSSSDRGTEHHIYKLVGD